LIIAMLAAPILIQVYFNAGLAYLLNRATGEAHCVAAPSALIGASNFFELAVAAAISLFGFNSGAALATVVGVLIEVPVMLSVVKIVNNTRGWYEAGPAVKRRAATDRVALWFLSQRVLPPAVVLVPFYLLLVYLRLTDTWTGLILCYSNFNLAFVVVIMRDIFRDVSTEIEDAAKVEGATPARRQRAFLGSRRPTYRCS